MVLAALRHALVTLSADLKEDLPNPGLGLPPDIVDRRTAARLLAAGNQRGSRWPLYRFGLTALEEDKPMIRVLAAAAAFVAVLGSGDPVTATGDRSVTAREWYEQARELTRTKQRQQAADAFDRSVALDPERALVWANRGTNLLNMGRYEAALESYERALALDPSDPYIHCSRATVYNRTAQPDRALESSQEAIAADPGHIGALFNMATALRKLGRDDEADSVLERAYEMKRKQVD